MVGWLGGWVRGWLGGWVVGWLACRIPGIATNGPMFVGIVLANLGTATLAKAWCCMFHPNAMATRASTSNSEALLASSGDVPFATSKKRVWVEMKPPADRRFWSMLPLARLIHFGYTFF